MTIVPLLPDAIIVPTGKIYAPVNPKCQPVKLGVIHWTASPPKSPKAPDLPRMTGWLKDPDRKTSTGFIILRDGRLVQAAGIDCRTWHAGGAVWTDPDGTVVDHPNFCSFGIDLENVGPVHLNPDHDGYLDPYGYTYHGETPVQLHEPYTDAQLGTFLRLVAELARAVPILQDPARWVGHQEIQAGKTDPGPLLPWDDLHAAVTGAS